MEKRHRLDHFLQDQHHSPTPLTGRSPSIKSPSSSNKKKKGSPSPKNYVNEVRKRPKWAWNRKKKEERGVRKQLFLYEGPEDGPVNLQNDGAGGNVKYRREVGYLWATQ